MLPKSRGAISLRGRLRPTVACLALLALTLGAAACAPGADDNSSEPGEETTVTIALSSLGTMDFAPMTSNEDNEKFLMLMGNNLVGVDPVTSEVVGELAESWEVSDDGLTWTFHLRPDVPFQGGYGTVTSEDVKWSWEQWASPDSTHTVQEFYSDAIDGSMDNFEIIDDLTFALHAAKPVQLLPFICSCTPAMTVFPKAYYEEKGDEALTHPLGTGPYEYVSSKPGDEIVLKAFDDYWGGAPKVDNVVLKEIPDGAARLEQVKSGSIDMAQLDGSLAGEAEADTNLTIRGIQHIVSAWVLLGGSYWGNEHLDKDSPWIQADDLEKGKAIREALSLAIDRDAILDLALKGHGQITYGPMFQYPELEALNDPSWELPAYDPELAKQKLAEGGYPDGFPITLETYAGDIDTATMTELIAANWKDIGIDVKLHQNEEGRLKQDESTYKTDGRAWIRLSSFSPDPIKSISTTIDSPDISPKVTYPLVNETFEAMNVEPSLDERYAMARTLIKDLEDNFIAPSLVSGDMLFVSGPTITAWTPMPGLNTVSLLETIEMQ